MESSIRKFAPIAGILFPIFVLAGFVIEGNPPDVDDPAAEIVQFYVDNKSQTIVATFLAALGILALLVFGAELRTRLRDAGSQVLATIAFGGAVVAAAGAGVDSALRFALADSAGDTSDEALHAVYAIWSGFFWPMHLGFAALAAAVGLASLDSKMLPTPIIGLGLLAAVLLVLPVLPLALAGIALVAVWSIATGIVLLRRPIATPA
jgi:hypothetical protein